jgi:hypothetical protein
MKAHTHLYRLLALAAAGLIGARALAQSVTVGEAVKPEESAELKAFKERIQAANPGMDIVSIDAQRSATLAARPKPAANPRIAIFVKNQTATVGLNDLVDGVRDRLGAELAGAGLIVLDKAEIADGFTRFKVTSEEERAGLVSGVFTGGSAVRVAQMLGVDYLMTASIIGADRATRTAGDQPVVTFTLRMSVKVSDAATGASVYGENWTRRSPVPAASAEGANATAYYNDLLDAWVQEAGAAIAAKAPAWRPAAAAAGQVTFTVTTTVDELIQGLESGVRAPNELLGEMRRLVGGVTVELDGAAVGSSPGTFSCAPGLHQLRVSRAWMKDWQQTVNIQNGAAFRVALELSDAGLQRYQSLERFRALAALTYAEALAQKGVKVNFDTAAWRDVTIGNKSEKTTVTAIVPN